MKDMGFSEDGYDNPRYNPKKRLYSESDVFRFHHSDFHPGADVSHIVNKSSLSRRNSKRDSETALNGTEE